MPGVSLHYTAWTAWLLFACITLHGPVMPVATSLLVRLTSNITAWFNMPCQLAVATFRQDYQLHVRGCRCLLQSRWQTKSFA